MSPELLAAFRDIRDDLASVDPAEEGLDAEAVASVLADIELALTLKRAVPGCGA